MTRNINPTMMTEKPHSHLERGGSSRGRQDGGRSSSRGGGRGRGGEVRCYTCGKAGHKSWECLERKKEGEGEAHISEAQRINFEAEGAEDGTSLMLRKFLLKPEAKVEKLVQGTVSSGQLARLNIECAR
jgi:hypothetical protein